jgi:hypothetical protein
MIKVNAFYVNIDDAFWREKERLPLHMILDTQRKKEM